jgi:diguanylate cyclase (GGDEF)-like protein
VAQLVAAPVASRKALLRGLLEEHDLAWIGLLQGSARITVPGPAAEFAVAETRVRTPQGIVTLRVSVTGPREFKARAGELVGIPVAVGLGETVTAGDSALPRDILDLPAPPPQTIGVDGAPVDLRARVFELRGESGPAARIAIAAPLGESVLAGNGALIAASVIAFIAMAGLSAAFLLRGLGREHEGVVAQALTDGLTGLANHRHFRDTMTAEVERSQRYGHDLSVLLMDLDNFKQVNDTYGHPQGDEVLRRVADVLRAESRNIDQAARYGGEEFAILLPETDAEGAAEVGERIRRRLVKTEIPVEGSDRPLVMTGSMGVAGTPDVPLVPSALIEAADKALYEAKRAGKDRVIRSGAMNGNGTSGGHE